MPCLLSVDVAIRKMLVTIDIHRLARGTGSVRRFVRRLGSSGVNTARAGGRCLVGVPGSERASSEWAR